MENQSSYALVDVEPPEDDAGSDHSMDMVNDPRFTTTTVLDKRLSAFTAQVGFVGGLTSGASLGQCFELKKHLKFGYCTETPAYQIFQSVVQLVAFFGMSTVLFLSLYSTLVSVNQAYFGNRLMTVGANGFELARAFYMNPMMVNMRHKAVKFLARALILLLVSAGGMLYVKFSMDQDREAGFKLQQGKQSHGHASFCDWHIHPAGVVTMSLFTAMGAYLYWFIQIPHENLFREIYALRYHEEGFGRLLGELGHGPRVAEDRRSLRRTELSDTRQQAGGVTLSRQSVSRGLAPASCVCA